MALIYVEYITPKPGVALQDFHKIAGKQQAAWDQAFAEDELLLNLARTWRIGPLPPYLCIWHQPAHRPRAARPPGSASSSRARWTTSRTRSTSSSASTTPAATARSCRRSGDARGPYYAEFFEERDGAGAGRRDRALPGAGGAARRTGLHLLARRIGHLGPGSRATSRSGAARRTRPSGRSPRSWTVTRPPCAWSPPASTASWGGRSSREGGGRPAAAGEEGARDGREWRRPPARARVEHLLARGLSRREALRLTAGAGLLAGLPALLAACGDSDDDGGDASSAAAPTRPPASRPRRRRRRPPAAPPAGSREQRCGAGPVDRGVGAGASSAAPASSAAGGCASATSAAARPSRSTRRSARRSSTCRAT